MALHCRTISLHPRVFPSTCRPVIRFGVEWCRPFFVLSGYLLGGILLDPRELDNYYLTFYYRRFFRIIPLYLIILIFCQLARVAGSPSNLYNGSIPWYIYATFTQNIWIALHNDWGARALGGTWSLAVEEQFYLVLPIVIRYAKRLPYVLLSLIFIAPVFRWISISCFPTYTLAPLVLMPCRMDSLMIGVLGAWMVRNGRQFPRSILIVLVAGAVLMIYKQWTLNTNVLNTLGFSWIAWLYLGLLLLSINAQRRWITDRFLVDIGKISYGIYIYHGLTLITIRGEPAMKTNYPIFLTFLSFLATLLLAKLSWVYLEAPFIRMGHRKQYTA